jgi:ketosteroid isomerase-like protein
MSVEANRAVALQFYDHLSKAEFERMFALMADDAEWRVAGNPETFPPAGTLAKAERFRMFDDFVKTFASLVVSIVSTTAEEDRVCVEFTARGETHAGIVYENEYLSRLRFRDGRIVHVYEHCDQQAVFELGRALAAES